MHGHRVDTDLVTENVRLEVVYESNPSFAGEGIQLLIRLRHLGSERRLEQLEVERNTLKTSIEERAKARSSNNKPWLVKSLLDPFNRDEKAEEEHDKELEEDINKKMGFHQAVDLMSCYVQIYGVFQYDPEVIDRTELSKVNKLAGVSSLRSSYAVHSLSETVAGFFFTSFDEMTTAAVKGNEPTLEVVPILLIPQTLLFSEVSLKPGEVKTYQFKSPKLPYDLPPTYRSSKHIKIQYFANFGITNVKDDKLKPFNADFSLNICPFIDARGCQFTSSLNQDLVILPPGRVKEYKDTSKNRRKSVASVIPRRRSSLLPTNSIENRLRTSQQAKDKFKELVLELNSTDEFKADLEVLVDQILDTQFGPEKYESSSDDEDERNPSQQNNLVKMQKLDPRVRKDSIGSVRHNINNLSGLVPAAIYLPAEDAEKEHELKGLIPQIKNCQKEYIINRNGHFICKVSFSKYFYDISDDIDLVVELCKDESYKISAVSATLESFELINPKFCIDGSSAKAKPEGNILYENRAICFDNSFSIPMKILPQKSPSNQITSQFRTDVFQLKWMLRFRFVLLSKSEESNSLDKFYEDKNGSLSHAKKYLEGEEFMCHVPISILPTSKDFGGW